tara:strand:+ start:1074 stop:1397 length:324 start_codon:yes stop_codon:yes gene_type:complete
MAKEKLKKVIKGLKKASKTHAKQAKTLESIAKFGKGGSAKKDACYHKVKSRYKVWPSAYASGALVKCRKVGAKNWGNKTKKMSTGGHVVSRGLTNLLPGKKRRTKLG